MRLGIDLGTGSLKLMAADEAGHPIATASRPYRVLSPESGAAETDVEEWITALRDSWTELSGRLGEEGLDGRIESIGLCGQMHGVVPVDSGGRALHPAILWADSRSAEFLPAFEQIDPEIRSRLMNAPAAGMAAVVILWFKKYAPAVYEKAACFLFPKDYVRLRLTGQIATDRGDASAGLLYDFVLREWSEEILNGLGVDRSKLPPIKDSFESGGKVGRSGASDTGLPEGIPVAIGSSDAACALFGSGLFNDVLRPSYPSGAGSTGISGGLIGGHLNGPVQISVGSGAQVFQALRELPPFDPALNCYEAAVDGVRYRMAAMLNGGVALEWVRSAVGIEWDAFYDDFDAARIQLPDDLVFLPYLTGERTPYGDADARGAWIGLGLHHDRRQLLGAALLGVACTVKLGMESLGVESNTRAYLVGGSSRREGWRVTLASVLERKLELCSVTDASALGAALIGAASAAGADSSSALDYAPPLPVTEAIEPRHLPWLESYYRRFKDCYRVLYGKEGAYRKKQ
jgi:xylulokinase